VTASKLIAKTGRLQIQFGIYVDKFMVFFGKKNLGLSAMLGVSFPRKFNQV